MRGTELRYGASGSCGCLNKEISRDVCIRRNTTHSMSDTLTYGIWQNMKARCYEPKTSGYARYGGRGITICDRWRESFENFFADMGECPKGLSIERRANNGNYEPDNCHWASKRAQANNRSSNRPLTFNGKTQNCAEWAREIGIRPQELYKRLKRGLPLDRVLTKHLR